MGIEHPAEHGPIIPTVSKTTLHLEMHSDERQVLTNFREQFMRWVNDCAASAFAGDAGAPQKITFEEGAADDSGLAAVLNLDLVWSSRHGAAKAGQPLPATSASAAGEPSVPEIEPVKRFVFFPDPSSETPRHQAAALFDGTTLHHVPGRVEWVRMERPVLLELLLKCVAVSVRAYDATKSRLAQVVDDPSLLVPTKAWLHAFATPHAVRIRMSKSAMRASFSWLTAVRTGSVYAAVGCVTLLLVFAAYKSRTSDVIAADQTAGTESLRTHETVPAASATAQPAPPDATLGGAASSGVPVGVPLAQSMATLNRPSVSPAASPLDTTEVATVGDAAPAPAPALPKVFDAPRATDRVAVQASPPATPVTPVSMVGRSEIVGGLLVVSEPSGAEVSINGVAHGHTPVQIENLAAGTRVVRLELPGYERWSWAVTVVANKRTPVTVKLQPEGRRLGVSN